MNEAYYYKSKYMDNLIQYIENNLIYGLDTDLLSNVGFVSHTQMYRDFYSLTGHSVMEYIRKRRLSNALALIKTSDFPLADIAYQCGYSSQQALCRAVRQTLGLTPLEYKNGCIYYFFPPFNGALVQPVTVAGEIIPPVLCVLFYHSSPKNIENIATDALLKAFPDYSGRIFGRNGKQEGAKFCYEIYLTDIGKDYGRLGEYGFYISTESIIFSDLFATTLVRNAEREINAAWDFLYSEWLQKSMFEYTNEPYFEEYIIRNGKPLKLKLYLPIRKRVEETKISLINAPGLRFIAAKSNGYNAEKTASKKVINHLTAHYPHILKTSKEFYLHKTPNSCVCGVRVEAGFRIAEDESIEEIVTENINYLVMESSVMGDYDRYADLLLSFARNNGMKAVKDEIFAVYDTKESFDNPKIRMYCPVKGGTK